MDDVQLLQQVAGGDEDAFELIVRRHADRAWRLARSILSDDHTAEEAVQDTFVKVLGAADTFRGDAQVATWIMSICRRCCLDRLRRRRLPVVSLDEARAARDARQAASVDVDLRHDLEAAAERLPESEREAFVLVDVLGYSRDDAATIVGCPASTMRSRVSRARNRLAEDLAHLRPTAARGV